MSSIVSNLLRNKPELEDSIEWLLFDFSEYFERDDATFDIDQFMVSCGLKEYAKMLEGIRSRSEKRKADSS